MYNWMMERNLVWLLSAKMADIYIYQHTNSSAARRYQHYSGWCPVSLPIPTYSNIADVQKAAIFLSQYVYVYIWMYIYEYIWVYIHMYYILVSKTKKEVILKCGFPFFTFLICFSFIIPIIAFNKFSFEIQMI